MHKGTTGVDAGYAITSENKEILEAGLENLAKVKLIRKKKLKSSVIDIIGRNEVFRLSIFIT